MPPDVPSEDPEDPEDDPDEPLDDPEEPLDDPDDPLDEPEEPDPDDPELPPELDPDELEPDEPPVCASQPSASGTAVLPASAPTRVAATSVVATRGRSALRMRPPARRAP